MILQLSAVGLFVPVLLGHLLGYQISPVFLLTPLVAWAFFAQIQTRFAILFACLVASGAVSIGVAMAFDPGHLPANAVNFAIEALMPASFVFLGIFCAARYGLRNTVFWCAVAASVFVLACAIPVLITGGSVRVIDAMHGTTSLNVSFLSLPVYATFGVNSLSPIFCMASGIIGAAAYYARGWRQALFAIALFCSVFVAMGSESRSAALSILLLGAVTCGALIPRFHLARRPLLIILVAIVAGACAASFSASTTRLTGTASALTDLVTGEQQFSAENVTGLAVAEGDVTAGDAITTGRIILWQVALAEWASSPWFGNGFSGFGRFNDEHARTIPKNLGHNVSAHNVYINALWKGGAIYFLIYAGLIAALMWSAMRSAFSATRIFIAAAVAMMFLVSSLFWDVLNVPAPGAMAWFLLGLLAQRQPLAGSK